MSWITKAETFLNMIDESAANVLQQPKDETPIIEVSMQKNISKNLKGMKLIAKNDDKWESMSETMSRRSSISSKHETVIDRGEDQMSNQLKESFSNASLSNSFSVEKELAATKILTSELRSENIDLKSELDTVLEQMKANSNSTKIQDLENLLITLQDEKDETTKKSQLLQTANSNYVRTISEMETSILKMQQTENDLTQKLEYAKNEATDANNELQQYRLRAQHQLQQLKAQLSGDEAVKNEDNNDTTLQFEINQLKDQRDNLSENLILLTSRFEESKSFIERMEHKHRILQAEAEDKISQSLQIISQLNSKTSQHEDETRFLKEEIVQVREEMLKQKVLMTTKLHEKENELKRLKNSYRESQMQTELENRMHSLTQSLLSKQNSLENITAERNALKFQLEKLSHQHEELLRQTRPQRPQIITMNETDDAKSQFPNFMMPNSFDSSVRHVRRGVSRAYSNIDYIGARLGVFLRRYPLARIFSVFYVFLLHIFVIFVLLSTTPSQ